MKFFGLLMTIALAQGAKIENIYDLTKDEEARAVENAIVDRVVPKLDSEVAHGSDADHSAAKAAFTGAIPSHGDF